MSTRWVCLGLGALLMGAVGHVGAVPGGGGGPEGGGGPGGGGGLGDILPALWEWGEPAIRGAWEIQSGVVGGAGDLTLPGQIGATLFVPNDLPLNRAYQARLRGVLLDGEGAPLGAAEILSPWQPFDPRLEEVGVTATWSPEGLEAASAGVVTARLIAEVALAAPGGAEIVVESEAFDVGLRLERAGAMAALLPATGGLVRVEDVSTGIAGAEVIVPPGALPGSAALKVAPIPATRLPFHRGYRSWRSQPVELRVEGSEELRSPVTLTLPLLAGGVGEVPGMLRWEPLVEDYVGVPRSAGDAERVSVTTTSTTYWGATDALTGGASFDLTLDIRGPGGETLGEGSCAGGACPEEKGFLFGSVGRLQNGGAAPFELRASVTLGGAGSSPAGLGVATSAEDGAVAGQCLEASWGSRSLLPGGDVFGPGQSLLGLMDDEASSCNPIERQLENPTALPLSRALVPGMAELVTWVVPNPGQVYSGPPPSTCSADTLTALDAYLSPEQDLMAGVRGELDPSAGLGGYVDVYPVMFNCLWLRVDPTVETASALFDDDGTPDAVSITLPGAMDAAQGDAFLSQTQATLLFQAAPEQSTDGVPATQDAADAALMDLCRGAAPTGDILPEEIHLSVLEGLTPEGDATRLDYALPGGILPDAAPMGAFVLKLAQTGDAASVDCAAVDFRRDTDGDGASPYAWDPALRDCDDEDATVYPHAAEDCDQKDNDCDENIDEGLDGEEVAVFGDVDGDGYGALSDAGLVTICEGSLPEDVSTEAGDCDDGDASIHPGVTEVCDGVDGDCDGESDEGLLQSAFSDGDGDGYGRPDTEVAVCDLAPGQASQGGDCDDGDASRNPGALDVCNGINDDCDGAIDEAIDDALKAARYRDEDGDGFGVGNATLVCADAEGWAGAGGDCDDADPRVSPGAPRSPALNDAGTSRYFGCDPAQAYALSDLDEDGRRDALAVAPGEGIQARIDDLKALSAHLLTFGLADVYHAPGGLILAPGTYRERLFISEMDLRVEGRRGADGALPRLDGQGSSCAQAGEDRCSTIALAQGARVSLRGLSVEGGLGSTPRGLGEEGSFITTTYGGGIAALKSALTLEKVTVTGNTAELGAAIAVLGEGATLSLSNSALHHNLVEPREGLLFSGALYVEAAEAWVFNSEITDNSNGSPQESGFGGGLTAIDSPLTALSNRIADNWAQDGAGVMIVDTGVGSGRLALLNNRIEGNQARGSGGGIDVFRTAGGDPEDVRLEGNIILHNQALEGVGGGVFLEQGAVAFRNNWIAENQAGSTGGGLHAWGQEAQILEQSIFAGNGLWPSQPGGEADLDAAGGGSVEVRRSILLPLFDGSLGCGPLSFTESGAYGVEQPLAAPCQDASHLGMLVAPEGAATPFLNYSPALAVDAQDLRIRPGATLEQIPHLGVPEAGARESGQTSQSAEDLGAFGGALGHLGVGPIVPDCGLGRPLTFWDGWPLQLTGALSALDASEETGSVREDTLIFYGDPEHPIQVEKVAGAFDVEVEVIASVEGLCGSGIIEGPTPLSNGDRTTFHPTTRGYALLKVRGVSSTSRGPYWLEVTQEP